MFNFLYCFWPKRISLTKKDRTPLFSQVLLFWQFVFFSALLVMYIWVPEAEAFQTRSAYEQLKVKAAFVLNLARFVEWPDDPENSKTKDVVLCFYQYNFLDQSIDTIRNKRIHNKVLKIKVIKSLKIKERCEVVLVPATSLQTFLQYNEYEDLQNRITITDLSSELSQVSSLENKVIFRLKRDQSRLRFEVNKKAAEQLGVNIGSELLKLGIIVTDPENNKKFNDQGRNKQ